MRARRELSPRPAAQAFRLARKAMELMISFLLLLIDLLAQRDIDNARQSFIVEREKNDDDLPDFNELEGPPDESEDEEIEAEIED